MALSGGFHQSCCGVKPIEQNYNDWKDYLDWVYPGYESIKNHVDLFYDAAWKLCSDNNIALDNKWDRDIIITKLSDHMSVGQDDVKISEDLQRVIELHVMLDKHISGDKKLNIPGLSDMDISVHCKMHEKYVDVVEDIFQILKDAGYERIWLRKIPRKWNFKYAIMGPDLTRPIDIYRIDIMDVQLMRKFHLDPVRILWNGTRRWALSSSIGFHLTGVVATMIWLSNNKDPIDLVTTYLIRGCSKFTNKKMGETLHNAMETQQPFNKYPIIYGPVAHNHGIFVDKLISRGKKILMNNSKLHWSKYDGHKWHDGMKVTIPDIKSFHGHISEAMR
jgi:hypothetical protein